MGDAKQLVTFMHGSVAARIDSPEFWAGLERLRSEWRMDAELLVLFMSDSVAARIGKPKDKFWIGLNQLQACKAVSTRALCEVMCGGIASRMDVPYANSIARIATHLGTLQDPEPS